MLIFLLKDDHVFFPYCGNSEDIVCFKRINYVFACIKIDKAE